MCIYIYMYNAYMIYVYHYQKVFSNSICLVIGRFTPSFVGYIYKSCT